MVKLQRQDNIRKKKKSPLKDKQETIESLLLNTTLAGDSKVNNQDIISNIDQSPSPRMIQAQVIPYMYTEENNRDNTPVQQNSLQQPEVVEYSSNFELIENSAI